MQQSLAHPRTAALDPTGQTPTGEEPQAAASRHFSTIHEMEEPPVPAEERRVPLFVSLSLLLVVSLAMWAGLIWAVTSIL